jgi:cytochrome c
LAVKRSFEALQGKCELIYLKPMPLPPEDRGNEEISMDSFEMTKIAGAVLSALLLIFGTKTLIESATHHGPVTPGYELPVAAAPAVESQATDNKEAAASADAAKTAEAPADAAAAPAAGGADVVALLASASASAENGKASFAKCKACHAAEKGKPNGVGPNLYGIVNRAKGKAEGFKYSEAMLAKSGEWTFENLSSFLLNPKAYVAGTKMVFAGLPAAADRADLIAYLATLADTPVELPK